MICESLRGGYRMEKLVKSLARVWHFRHLSMQELRHIVSAGTLRRYRKDAFIFHEAEKSAGMFVLLRGKVHLRKLSPTAQEQIIATIEPVIMFNELTAIDGGPNPYSAQATKACLTWNISNKAFIDLVRQYPDPEIGLGLLRVLAARTRLLINRCEDLSYLPVLSRTAKLLLDLSDNGETVIDRSEHSITELAAHIASVPEVVSRSLSRLDGKGIIECSRTQILIHQTNRLIEIAQIEPS
jgi:CRP-like cAMP-binding protein